jgi:V/A-type H+-transporting ATPase subunit C
MTGTASYSVMAKVRARYGRILNEQDYDALLACRSLVEFAAYLRGKREYEAAMKELAGSLVNRGLLEFLLRENLFRDNISICMALESFGKGLADFIIGLEEANFILTILRRLQSPDENPYIAALPRAFYRYTKIDFSALQAAHDYISFLEAIRESRYFPILEPYRQHSEGTLDITAIESAIFHRLFGDILKSGKISDDLRALISTRTELSNLALLFRAKKIYGDTGDVSPLLLPFWYKLDKRTVDELITGNFRNFIDTLSHTVYGSLVTGIDRGYDLEIEGRRILHSKCVHTLHFSMDSQALVFAYLQLRRIELQNLIIIIEGIRYNVNAQSVKRLLVY